MQKKFKGWTIPGPTIPDLELEGTVSPELAWLREELAQNRITKDALSGHFRIYQYKDGHRYSTDDLLAAWYGAVQAPGAVRCLDLGSGIGSVAQVAAWKLVGSEWTTVEAQDLSVKLSPLSIKGNGLASRFRVFHGDLRDDPREAPHAWREIALNSMPLAPPPWQNGFELITSSPPYFPLGTGITADHSQKAACRFELRGDVTDYLKRAKSLLAPAGIHSGIFPWLQRHRVLDALEDLELICLKARPVVFKEGQDPLMWLYAVGHASDYPEALVASLAATPDSKTSRPLFEEPALIIRTREGLVSPEYQTVKLSIGFGP